MEVQAGVVESFSLQLFSFLSADATQSSSGSILLCRVIIMIATRALVFGVCFLFVARQVRGLTTPSPAKLTTPIRPNNNNSHKSTSTSESTVVLLYNKPANVVTSHVHSEDARPTVYDEIQSMKGFVASKEELSFQEATGIQSKLHAIGRLDAETTGLLLLTNDGRLVHHVTNPSAKHDDTQQKTTPKVITKTYQAWIMGHHTEETLEPIRKGVDIGAKYGGMTKPVHDLTILEHPNHKSTVVSLTISEGKNRQVRRMFHAIGSGVMKLHRTAIGQDLTLDGVQEGEWRILSSEEVRHALFYEPRELIADNQQQTPQKQRRQPPSGRSNHNPANGSGGGRQRRKRR